MQCFSGQSQASMYDTAAAATRSTEQMTALEDLPYKQPCQHPGYEALVARSLRQEHTWHGESWRQDGAHRHHGAWPHHTIAHQRHDGGHGHTHAHAHHAWLWGGIPHGCLLKISSLALIHVLLMLIWPCAPSPTILQCSAVEFLCLHWTPLSFQAMLSDQSTTNAIPIAGMQT